MHRLVLILCLYLSSCLPSQAAPTMWMCTGLTNPSAAPYLLRFDSQTLLLEVYSKGGTLEYDIVLEPQQTHKELRGFAAVVEDGDTAYAVTFFQHVKTKQVYYAITTTDDAAPVALWECR